MRRIASFLILLAGACDNGHPPQRPPHNVAQPAPGAPTRAASTPAPVPVANEAHAAPADAPPPDEPGVAGLSPAQRRAWELGYRDCSHGRYAPDNHLEAYRIGCGAAHERMESRPPPG